EDQMPLAIHRVPVFLWLMTRDDDLRADRVGEFVGAFWRRPAAPDELVRGAFFAGVVGAGEFAIVDGEVEGLDFLVWRKAVAEEEPVGRARCERDREKEFRDRRDDGFGMIAEIASDRCGERFAHATTRFADAFAVDLCEIVIAEEKV